MDNLRVEFPQGWYEENERRLRFSSLEDTSTWLKSIGFSSAQATTTAGASYSDSAYDGR